MKSVQTLTGTEIFVYHEGSRLILEEGSLAQSIYAHLAQDAAVDLAKLILDEAGKIQDATDS